MNEITVAIADDHQLFRKGVIHSLSPYKQLRFVLEAGTGDELLSGLANEPVQVVLMDLKMPGKDGIETTKLINRNYPDIKVLIVSMYEDERFVHHLMENGAHGYLLKNAEPQEMLKAITDVIEKGYYLNDFVNRILLRTAGHKQKNLPALDIDLALSDREKMVLRLICMEFTAQEIAQKMELSSRTVEAIKDRLMDRFGSKNTAGLVFFAVRNHLID
ncbi:MAG TPA: DNA-binding response regulator [Chitinophagaceae bacterium]|nr:response regulator transcription factor [Bacteroidota bacterium]HBB57561.1 DNA-binding response regulator [Chitinophagaceae bacterium]